MKRSALAVLAVLAVVLLVVGCGGSGSSGSGSTIEGPHNDEVGGPGEAGGGKKATAPNAPAGSKVVACKEGGGKTVQLRATAVECVIARATMRRWQSSRACALGKSESRGSCSLGGFRCQAVKVDRGATVRRARPGGDLSFIAPDRPLKSAG
jgi:hypothetical protein